MRKITTIFALTLFALPSVSFAAALTTQQSTSLIAVVQSSPGTPASAFVSLITAFSNITVNQASSLITVVQASPSTPATAFVDLLTSFTDDTSITQSVAQDSALKTQVETLMQQVETLQQSQAQQNTETQQKLGQIVQNTTPSPAVEIPAPPPGVKELDVEVSKISGGTTESLTISYSENGKKLIGIPVTISADNGYFLIAGEVGKDADAGKKFSSYTYTTQQDGILEPVGNINVRANGVQVGHYNDGTDWVVRDRFGAIIGQRDDGAFYPGTIFTVTAEGITKTVQGGSIYRLNK